VSSCGPLTVMVVKRKTHSTRLDGLQTCRTACAVQVCPRRVAFERLRLGGSEGPLTERSLQLNGSHHDRITELVIHQQQPESQELLRRPARSRPNPAEGLASHSCEAGLSQGHPHIARCHTSSCQLNKPHHIQTQTPFDGLGSHTSLGGGRYSSLMHSESCNCRVR
jgi:hypothetical protein